MTSALQKSECCSQVEPSAAQHSENCSAAFVFACGMLQGWGLEGWGLGLSDLCNPPISVVSNIILRYPSFRERQGGGWKTQGSGKPQKHQGFCSPCEPLKTLENKQKTFKKTKELRSNKKNQGNENNKEKKDREHTMKPLPKSGFGPPHLRYVSPPPPPRLSMPCHFP